MRALEWRPKNMERSFSKKELEVAEILINLENLIARSEYSFPLPRSWAVRKRVVRRARRNRCAPLDLLDSPAPSSSAVFGTPCPNNGGTPPSALFEVEASSRLATPAVSVEKPKRAIRVYLSKKRLFHGEKQQEMEEKVRIDNNNLWAFNHEQKAQVMFWSDRRKREDPQLLQPEGCIQIVDPHQQAFAMDPTAAVSRKRERPHCQYGQLRLPSPSLGLSDYNLRIEQNSGVTPLETLSASEWSAKRPKYAEARRNRKDKMIYNKMKDQKLCAPFPNSTLIY